MDPADPAAFQEERIEWIRETGIAPAPVLYELVIHSPRPFTNPTPHWRAGKLWAFSVLCRTARASTDAHGTTGYTRRIWFEVYDPREIEREPLAAGAVRVKTSSIAAGRISEPAE